MCARWFARVRVRAFYIIKVLFGLGVARQAPVKRRKVNRKNWRTLAFIVPEVAYYKKVS